MKVSVERTLEGLFQDLGPVPGLYYDSFQAFLNLRMAKILEDENIPIFDLAFSMRNCSLDIKCRDYLSLALNFIIRVDWIFQRPFPKLGTWISLFAKKVFSGSGFEATLTKLEVQVHSFLAKLLSEYYQQVLLSLYVNDHKRQNHLAN